MTDACDQWYVELSLGPVLGPMSREDLEALAHSRGVLASDRIRQGNSESWQTAREIRGLFPDDRHPPDSTPASRLTADNHNRRARDREQQPEPVPHTPDKNTEPPVTRPAGHWRRNPVKSRRRLTSMSSARPLSATPQVSARATSH